MQSNTPSFLVNWERVVSDLNNIFMKEELIRVFFYQGYILCLIIMHRSLNHMHVAWRVIYFFCVFVSLVPQQVIEWKWLIMISISVFVAVLKKTLSSTQLLEFRYFIIPYMIFRVHLIAPSFSSTVVEFLMYLSVDIASLGLYIYKPFKWEGNSDSQRFMW